MTAGHAPMTMSSIELLEIINQARSDFGEAEVRRNQFNDRVMDELEGTHYKSFVVPNGNGTESVVFELTHDQCMLVSMRESKAVRRNVLEKLKGKQAPAFPIPQSMSEALRLAADLSEQNERLAIERDTAVRTKAEIGSRREATAMATAAARSKQVAKLQHELGRNQQHATVIAVEKASGRKFAKNAYVSLRRATKQYGLEAVSVVDPRYGSVKAWPAVAWRECYGIDLSDLFPGAEAA